MNKRAAIYVRLNSSPTGTHHELTDYLRQTVEERGDTVNSIYTDDANIIGKGKNAGWRQLLTDLETVEQIVLADVGDLPGRTVNDLLSLLTSLTATGVSMVVPSLSIDTAAGSDAILDLIAAYRAAKLSQAIRRGLEKARQEGRRIGRPPIPPGVRRRIAAALAQGGGVRPVARRFNVSPASVVVIRQEMQAIADQQAA